MAEPNPASKGKARLRHKIAALMHSQTFRAFLILLIIYAGTMAYFILVVQPEPGKVPFESPATWIRDSGDTT